MEPSMAARQPLQEQQEQQRPQQPAPTAGAVADTSKRSKLDTVLYAFYEKTVAVISDLRVTGADSGTDLESALYTSIKDDSNPASPKVARSSSTSSVSHQPTGITSASASTTGISRAPGLAAKWFSLEVDVPPSLRPQLEPWKSVSTLIPELLLRSSTPPTPTSARTSFATVVPDPTTCVPPLIIDIILDTSALDPAKHVLMLAGHDGRHYRADGSDLAEGGTAVTTAPPRQNQVVLESWKVTFLPFSPPAAPSPSVFYQLCVPYFRALYTLTNALPATRLRSRLRDLRAQHDSHLQQIHDESDPAHLLADTPAPVSLDSLLDVVCRISAGHEQQQQFAQASQETGVNQALGVGHGAQGPTFSAGRGDGRVGEADRAPVASSRVFEPLPCKMGALQLQVTFRNQVDFSVDDSESLRNLLEMNVDEDYFRPTVAAHRPRSQIGHVNIPTSIKDGQAQSSPVSPAKERPPGSLQYPSSGPSRRSIAESPSSASRPSSSLQRMPTLPPLPTFTSSRAAQTPSSTTSSPIFSTAAEAAQYYAQIAPGQAGQVPIPPQPSPSPSSLSRSPSVFNAAAQSTKPVAGLSSLRRASSLNPTAQSPNLWPGTPGFNVATGLGAGASAASGLPAGMGSFRSSSNVGLASLQGGSSGIGAGVSTPPSMQYHSPSADAVGPSSPSFSAALAAGEHPAFRIQHSRRPSISDRDRRLRSVGSFSSEAQNYYGLGTDSPTGYGAGTPGSGGGQYGYPYAYAGSLGSAGGAAMLSGGGFATASILQRQPLVRASPNMVPGSLPVRGATSYSPSSPLPLASQAGTPGHAYGFPVTAQANALGTHLSSGAGPSSLAGSGYDAAMARRSLSLLTGGRRPPLPLSYSSSTTGTGASLSPSNYMMSQLAATGNVRSIFEKYAPSSSTRTGSSAATPTSPRLRRQSQMGGGSVPGGGSPRAATATSTMGALERRSIAIAASKRSEEAVEKGGTAGGVAGGSFAAAPGALSESATARAAARAAILDEEATESGAASPISFGEGGVARRGSGGSITKVGSAPTWTAAGERLRRKSSALSAYGGARPVFSAESSPRDDDLGAFVRMLDARPSLSTPKDPHLELSEKDESPFESTELQKEAPPREKTGETSPPPVSGSLSFSSRMSRVGSLPLTNLSATTGFTNTRQPAAPMNRAQIDDMLQRMVLNVKSEFPNSADNSLFIRSGPGQSRITTRSSFGGPLSRQPSVVGPPGSVPAHGSLNTAMGPMGAAMDQNHSGSGSGSGTGSGFSLRGGHARAGSNIGHAAFPPASRGTGAYTAISLDKLPPPDKHYDDPGEDEGAGRMELPEGEDEGWLEEAVRRGHEAARTLNARRQGTDTSTGAPPAASHRDQSAGSRWRRAAAGTAAPPGVAHNGMNADFTARSYAGGSNQVDAFSREDAGLQAFQPATYAGQSRFGSGRGAYWAGGMRNLDAVGAGATGGAAGGVDPASVAGGAGADVNMTFPRMRNDGHTRRLSPRSPAEEAGRSYAAPYVSRNNGGGSSIPSTSPSGAPPGDAAGDATGPKRTYGGFGTGLPPPGPVYGFAPSMPLSSPNTLGARRRGPAGPAPSGGGGGPSQGTSPIWSGGPGRSA
ncbi:unnamed protein product [Tilletia controversa]|nr:hypothetical protein CF328_g3451 [Tilletia controversa]CAD6901203.1 unnamed protein product [Tilletia controversa]